MPRRAKDVAAALLLVGILGMAAFIVLRVRTWDRQELSVQDADDYTRPGVKRQAVTIPGRPHYIPRFLSDPDSIRRQKTFHFSTNSFGLRGAEIPLDKPAGGLRIVAVGECVTFGNGVDDHQTYPAQLEVALRARLPDRDVEVINGGLNFGPQQILDAFQQRMLRLEPDVVIFGPGGSSVFAPEHIGTAPPRNWLDQAEYDRQLVDFRQVMQTMVGLSEQHDFALMLVAPAYNSFFLPDGQLFVQAVNTFGAERGIPTVDPVALFAAHERQDGLMLERADGWQRVVRYRGGTPELLFEVQGLHEEERHLEPELCDWLDQHPDVSQLLSIDGNHPTPQGHGLIVVELLAGLEQLGVIPAAPNP